LCIFADCARCRAGSVAFWSWPFIFADSLAASPGPASIKPSANGNRENTHRCSSCDVFLVNWVTRSMFLHNAGNAGPDPSFLK
jgi:hypothetical protein